MDRKLKDYIINNQTSPEMIFRNYKEFLDILFDCGGAVSEILWFEYVLQEKQKDSLGGGGWIDKENPEYMWAETMIFDKGLENRSHAEIVEYIEKVTKRTNSYKLYNECSESLSLPKESVDFAFSCPPYFILEKYCDEDTQSINKFPEYEQWLEFYVRPTIKNCYNALKDCRGNINGR